MMRNRRKCKRADARGRRKWCPRIHWKRVLRVPGEHTAQQSAQEVRVKAMPADGTSPIIFKSELDFISRCILDYPDIETGGQLFGYWTENGTPVVMFAIGPGKRANHQVTFFKQDVDYLLAVGTGLKELNGLRHIGEWHSHHRLGLAQPSGHDVSTMVNTIRDKGLGRFLLCIGNCNNSGTSLNPFICDERDCYAAGWNIIFDESPVRKQVYLYMSDAVIEPTTKSARYMDSRLNGVPEYPSESWMKKKGSGQILKVMMDYVRSHHTPFASTKVELDGQGKVHILTRDVLWKAGAWEEDIAFPDRFPEDAPECRIGNRQGSKLVDALWPNSGSPFGRFKSYYENVIKKY